MTTSVRRVSRLGLMDYFPDPPVRNFDRDPETNEVLWFAAPPLNTARRPAPRYSLDYLHWLAMKRRKVDEDRMEVDEDCVKRGRNLVKATATEMVEKVLM